MRSPLVYALLASVLLSSPVLAQDKATIAVAPFTFHKNVRARPEAELETATLTKKFITELGLSRKFDVVERDELDRLMDEMALTDAGFTDPSRGIKAGQMYGVDYFLMGEISVFSVTTRVKDIPRTSRWTRTVDIRLIADMRIVDSRTSKIVSTEKGDVQKVWRKISRARPNANAKVEPATLDEIQRELCQQLVRKVIDAVFPLKVINMNASGVVFVNRGRSAGIAQGDVYDCFTEGEALIDPDTGENLGSEETKVARIRITQVLAKFSKAEVVGGSPAKGLICRLAKGPAEFSAPPAPPQDLQGPKIKILAPRAGQKINVAPVNIVVEVADNVQVSRVTINGVETPRDNRGRHRVVMRQPKNGANVVRVEAWDSSGNHSISEHQFVFDSTPPGVEASASILVEGTVDDRSCTLTINGIKVQYDPQTGAYSARVPANPSQPHRVEIVATDEFGNKTTEIRNIR